MSALAGRRLTEPEAKLSIMAVGDDDQNIYGFNGASVEFIRRFQTDYDGNVTYLVENFRSTQNIIAAANHVIQRAGDRMKVDHPIRIDTRRSADPTGGRWAALDCEHSGKVRLVTAPADANHQAQVVFAEVDRIRQADPAVPLGEIAILARTHRSLEPLRALCDIEGLRCEVLTREAARAQLSLTQSREGWRMADLLRSRKAGLVPAAALRRWLESQRRKAPENPYWEDLVSATAEVLDAATVTEIPAAEVLKALYESATESRRTGHPGALKLMTAHGAKGLEFKHVIVMDCADWRWNGEDERRLLYVAMTRAKETLTVMRAEGGRNPYLVDLGTVEGVIDLLPAARPERRPDIARRYVTLGPADVDIGFSGRLRSSDPVHARIEGISWGSRVVVSGKQVSATQCGPIGRLASRKEPRAVTTPGTVSGILVRTREQTAPEYQSGLKVDRWETVLVEMIVEGED